MTTADTVAAQDNIGVCEPIGSIKQRNNAGSKLWFQRCAESGSKNTCGNRAEWPVGDGGRCAMSSAAATVSVHDEIPTPSGGTRPRGIDRWQVISDCKVKVIDKYKRIEALCMSRRRCGDLALCQGKELCRPITSRLWVNERDAELNKC